MNKSDKNTSAGEIRKEAARRRTFAIISHPDAGKTTLTEKFLLYGNAIQLAGSVTAKKQQRDTTSDWMELEKKRGISISSTVLQFDYENYRLNILDTPGHKDFSEDTYRVLMAADAVIMMIDAGKGIESQTRILFEICSRCSIPIFTFMNKLDLPAMESFELIDQLEKMLDIKAFPVTWPFGSGKNFKGIFDRNKKAIHLFKRTPGGSYRAPVSIYNPDDPSVREILETDIYDETAEELELLDAAFDEIDYSEVLKGNVTPVYFGSAVNNFGVELMFKNFLKDSTEPLPRDSNKGPIALDTPGFSGFVFKVQTNMNPMHRDRMVFVRVCSGKFVRDMNVYHSRLKKKIRLASGHNVFGKERETVSTAYPGDIVGFVTRADFKVGDTLSTDKLIKYNVITRFAPEIFAYISNPKPSNYKSFRKGIEHFLAEDLVQAFHLPDNPDPLPLLGAVGPLQFEVLQHRLKEEYGADSSLRPMPWTFLRWIKTDMDIDDLKRALPYGASYGKDNLKRDVVLFTADWAAKAFEEKHNNVTLFPSPPE
ncbi:MAG: peptide chain release factor 3 [Elusimicrobia bacterium]|nr:peptide chain release factor 3 [Elusimicrobiota bacterium]